MSAPTTGADYAGCRSDEHYRCVRHGGKMTAPDECVTIDVLDAVRAERTRQFAKYGTNSDIEDGTGPNTAWLGHLASYLPAKAIEGELRQNYEEYEAETGKPTWVHLVLEEVAEAFAEDDPVRLREELVQVAALAVSWIEKLDERKEKAGG